MNPIECVQILIQILLMNINITINFRLTQPYVKKLQEARDVRSRLLTEYVRCIRLIKLQGWEEIWARKLWEAREEELKYVKTMRYLRFSILDQFSLKQSIFNGE